MGGRKVWLYLDSLVKILRGYFEAFFCVLFHEEDALEIGLIRLGLYRFSACDSPFFFTSEGNLDLSRNSKCNFTL